MTTNVKDEQKEIVKQHHRMAAGAWINGAQLKEQAKASIPKANTDHGSFNGKGVQKSNA
jgi:hypothetical protein